jgi:hypothetical protein
MFWGLQQALQTASPHTLQWCFDHKNENTMWHLKQALSTIANA